ncbi:MAG: ATP-binding protein [Treponema sp.]|jgi:energy-coupling factor transporter ATP-binding protein EcfA2|nr:ATP-binding protein [Treponema sp.]
MFKQAAIYNFKTFKKLENIQFDKITLIGGKNNSGKSSLLESLFFYLDRTNPNILNRSLSLRGMPDPLVYTFPMGSIGSPMGSPFFCDFDTSKEISIEVSEEVSKDTISGRLTLEYQKGYFPLQQTIMTIPYSSPIHYTASDEFGALSIKHTFGDNADFQARWIFNEKGLNYQPIMDTSVLSKPYFIFISRNISDAFDAERLGLLDVAGEQDVILDLLRVFEPKLKRLLLVQVGPQSVIHAVIENKKAVPLYLMGDGFCRCLSIILVLATFKNGILLLDEIENGVHYSIQNSLWQAIIKAVAKFNCQLIATTHSFEMISAFSKSAAHEGFKDVSYTRLEKEKDSHRAYYFPLDDLSDTLSYEMELR